MKRYFLWGAIKAPNLGGSITPLGEEEALFKGGHTQFWEGGTLFPTKKGNVLKRGLVWVYRISVRPRGVANLWPGEILGGAPKLGVL